MHIFSLIPFWTETELPHLLAKLSVEDHYVSHWLFVESSFTHQGNTNPLDLKAIVSSNPLFQKYLHKIIFFKNERSSLSQQEKSLSGLSSDPADKPREYELLQKLPIVNYLNSIPNYILILSDCDEFVDLMPDGNSHLLANIFSSSSSNVYSIQRIVFSGSILNLTPRVRYVNVISKDLFEQCPLQYLLHGRGFRGVPIMTNTPIACEFTSILPRIDVYQKLSNFTHAKELDYLASRQTFNYSFAMHKLFNCSISNPLDPTYPSNISEFYSLQSLSSISIFPSSIRSLFDHFPSYPVTTTYQKYRNMFNISVPDFSISDLCQNWSSGHTFMNLAQNI